MLMRMTHNSTSLLISVVDIGVAKMENCFKWMSQNKLNAEKTEVLVKDIPPMWAKICIPSITVNGVLAAVGNLGAVFDPYMNMSAHVSKVCKLAPKKHKKKLKISQY